MPIRKKSGNLFNDHRMTDLETKILCTHVFDSGMKQTILQQLWVVIYKAFCLDVAQGRMNEAPIENRTLS